MIESFVDCYLQGETFGPLALQPATKQGHAVSCDQEQQAGNTTALTRIERLSENPPRRPGFRGVSSYAVSRLSAG